MPTPLIYRTVTMLAAIQAMPTHRTFLRDRYFPTTAPVNGVSEDISRVRRSSSSTETAARRSHPA